MKKEARKNPKHVDTVVNSIQPLPLPITNTISNTYNNQRTHVDGFATNLSNSSCADKYVVSEKTSYSYDRTTSYPMDSFLSQGSKLSIGINSPIDNLISPSTRINSLSSSVISGITTPFLLPDSDQNYSSAKKLLNFNHQNPPLIILLILKVKTEYQLLTTIH